MQICRARVQDPSRNPTKARLSLLSCTVFLMITDASAPNRGRLSHYWQNSEGQTNTSRAVFLILTIAPPQFVVRARLGDALTLRPPATESGKMPSRGPRRAAAWGGYPFKSSHTYLRKCTLTASCLQCEIFNRDHGGRPKLERVLWPASQQAFDPFQNPADGIGGFSVSQDMPSYGCVTCIRRAVGF